MPQTGGALGFFVREFGLPLPAGPDGQIKFKCQLMGSHIDAIADAKKLAKEGVDWGQENRLLVQQLGPGVLVVGEVAYGDDGWSDPPSRLVKAGKVVKGHAYQNLTGTVIVTLPAAKQQQYAQGASYLTCLTRTLPKSSSWMQRTCTCQSGPQTALPAIRTTSSQLCGSRRGQNS
jgi:hypothetical protein